MTQHTFSRPTGRSPTGKRASAARRVVVFSDGEACGFCVDLSRRRASAGRELREISTRVAEGKTPTIRGGSDKWVLLGLLRSGGPAGEPLEPGSTDLVPVVSEQIH